MIYKHKRSTTINSYFANYFHKD